MVFPFLRHAASLAIKRIFLGLCIYEASSIIPSGIKLLFDIFSLLQFSDSWRSCHSSNSFSNSPFFILLYHPEPTSSTKVMSAFWVMHPAKIGIKRGENMAEKAILEISDGYKIEEKSYIVDCETACRILTSDKQRKFTYAKKRGENVELTQHIILRTPNARLSAICKRLADAELFKNSKDSEKCHQAMVRR